MFSLAYSHTQFLWHRLEFTNRILRAKITWAAALCLSFITSLELNCNKLSFLEDAT